MSKDQQDRVQEILELANICNHTQASRVITYKKLSQVYETGRSDGRGSLVNRMYAHIDRLAAHLFSPVELRFDIDFEYPYPKDILQKGKRVGEILTRDFERSSADTLFGLGVTEALKYGSYFLKQYVQSEGPNNVPVVQTRLVAPWNIGVFREDEFNLNRQPAICETSYLTMPEVWRRIYHLPDARKLMSRIESHARTGAYTDEVNTHYRNILFTGIMQMSGLSASTAPAPGGIAQIGAEPIAYGNEQTTMAPMVRMLELWQWDGDDWVTEQLIEPDILITRFKRSNLLFGKEAKSGLQPYTLIQPNQVHGTIWGRSELIDLVEPQNLLSQWTEDISRLFNLQIDKILGFSGFDGLTDENYGEFRSAGFFNMPPGAQVQDLTPRFPPESLQMLAHLNQTIDAIGGFDNILSGSGEAGVRAGNHADTLVKTASPRLRDRSLLIERQCAQAADLRLSIMEAKDGRYYWYDADKIEETKFLLTEIPEDRRVVVDSHSTSPIFMDSHQALVGFGVKAGIVDPESAIDMLPFPNKAILSQRLKEREQRQAAMMQKLEQENPEAYAKLMGKKK